MNHAQVHLEALNPPLTATLAEGSEAVKHTTDSFG